MTLVAESHIRALLRDTCKALGAEKRQNGRRLWAEANGLSWGYVDMVIAGSRPVSAEIAKALGYNKIVRFIPCGSASDVQ